MKAVIFDLDGVLTKTDKLHTEAWKEACRLWNIPFSPSVGELLRGVSRLDSAKIILEKAGCVLSGQELDRFAGSKNDIYNRLLNDLNNTDVCDGVMEVFEFLEHRGMRIAVASSSRNARKILSQLQIERRFDAVIDGTMIKKSKPDPEVFSRAVDSLGLLPEECLVVEDAASGVMAARCLGCHTAGIGKEAWYAGAEYKLQSISDIIRIMV